MNGTGQGRVVDEANDRLAALFDQKGWSRRDSVIANENRAALVWVDLLAELVDVDLVVIDRGPSDRVRDRPVSVSPCCAI